MEATEVTAELITNRAHELAEMVRIYCRSQVALWQEIPYWAYMADGRNGWSGTLSTAYRHGYWDVWGAACGWEFMVVVDLATGELQHGGSLLSDAEASYVAFVLESVNALGILRRLMHNTESPLRNWDSEASLATYKYRMEGFKPPRPYVRTS